MFRFPFSLLRYILKLLFKVSIILQKYADSVGLRLLYYKAKNILKNKIYILMILPTVVMHTNISSTTNNSSAPVFEWMDRATAEWLLVLVIFYGIRLLTILTVIEYPRWYFQRVGHKDPIFACYPDGRICYPDYSQYEDNSRVVSEPTQPGDVPTSDRSLFRVCNETCTAHHPSSEETATRVADVREWVNHCNPPAEALNSSFPSIEIDTFVPGSSSSLSRLTNSHFYETIGDPNIRLSLIGSENYMFWTDAFLNLYNRGILNTLR